MCCSDDGEAEDEEEKGMNASSCAQSEVLRAERGFEDEHVEVYLRW